MVEKARTEPTGSPDENINTPGFPFTVTLEQLGLDLTVPDECEGITGDGIEIAGPEDPNKPTVVMKLTSDAAINLAGKLLSMAHFARLERSPNETKIDHPPSSKPGSSDLIIEVA